MVRMTASPLQIKELMPATQDGCAGDRMGTIVPDIIPDRLIYSQPSALRESPSG
jgi:hypothetical protein